MRLKLLTVLAVLSWRVRLKRRALIAPRRGRQDEKAICADRGLNDRDA